MAGQSQQPIVAKYDLSNELFQRTGGACQLEFIPGHSCKWCDDQLNNQMPQMHLQVNVQKLNKRWLIPLSLPDRANIAGEVLFGFSFEGVEVDSTLVPNPTLGKWYKDRDGYYYWGGGVIDVTGDFESAESRGSETAFIEAPTTAIELS